ncbi:hypothetical protein [Zhongshania sp.]|uniref:hypothetical protein n=1 Tax=Zhongshania sp. TaxID=1971902 RepID=UPI003568DC14
MTQKRTKHIHIVLLLLSLLAQSFAYAYTPCPEPMDMDTSPTLTMPVDHSNMHMAHAMSKQTLADTSDNCCDSQQSDCPKSSCASAALLSANALYTLPSAPLSRAKFTLNNPKPAPLTSLYRPPINR